MVIIRRFLFCFGLLGLLAGCMETTNGTPTQTPNLSGVYQPIEDCNITLIGNTINEGAKESCLADMLTLVRTGNRYLGEYQFFSPYTQKLEYIGEFTLSNVRFSGSTVTANISGLGTQIFSYGTWNGSLDAVKNDLRGTVSFTLSGGIPQTMTWHITNGDDGRYRPIGRPRPPVFFNSAISHDLRLKESKNNQYLTPALAALSLSQDRLRQQRQQRTAAVLSGIANGLAGTANPSNGTELASGTTSNSTTPPPLSAARCIVLGGSQNSLGNFYTIRNSCSHRILVRYCSPRDPSNAQTCPTPAQLRTMHHNGQLGTRARHQYINAGATHRTLIETQHGINYYAVHQPTN